MAETLGVQLRQNITIQRLVIQHGRLLEVEVQSAAGTETLMADHYVVALGSYSRQLMQALGLYLPIYPVKGYSLTVPIVNNNAAPVSTVIDETYKVAITRFNQRIRVGGMAELTGFDLRLNPRRRATLEMVLNGLFPQAGDLSQALFWTGLRPMTPDGTPILGQASKAYPNVWLNTDHGLRFRTTIG